MSWAYTESMLQVPPLGTGITPLLQWIIVPPLAYVLAQALGRRHGTGVERMRVDSSFAAGARPGRHAARSRQAPAVTQGANE